MQISGDYEQEFFMGLRIDGVLVWSAQDHLESLGTDRLYSDFDGYQRIPGCGRDTTGALACFDYDVNDAVSLIPQPERDVRDYAQYAAMSAS